MTAHNNVPDPDRGGADSVNTSDMPQIFQNTEESDNSDDDAEVQNGYEMISQDDGGVDYEGDEGLTMEEQVAALVRAAHADQNNLSTETRELIQEASEIQRRETVEERAKIWSDIKPREDSIQLDDEKVETIKNLMSNIKLPQVPVWAAQLGDDVLKARGLGETQTHKS